MCQKNADKCNKVKFSFLVQTFDMIRLLGCIRGDQRAGVEVETVEDGMKKSKNNNAAALRPIFHADRCTPSRCCNRWRSQGDFASETFQLALGFLSISDYLLNS